MSSLPTIDTVAPESVQPFVSHNVRILMAYKGLNQRGVGDLIGKSATAVGHKLAGRAEWSADEIATLSRYGGEQWPLSRFFNDPESSQPTLPNIRAKLQSLTGQGSDPYPRTPILTTL